MTKIIAVGWFLIANHHTAVFNYANLRAAIIKTELFINCGDLEM
ncbi:Uncharacterised protein [Staphylococcus aureus]|uniref:Uncharacterized protein n=1 Tax=Staphylococcus aureus TaxID=1280 RepID=A0A380DK98_STAAU|nr:hypothetical protein [Staphylococcus aureus]ATV02950.1 hypothetical protein SaO11_00124 [Staphylococcus aureus O11]AUG72596.1 hypothetical protein SAO46_00118 [Staphylococcus aureus O46]EGS85286.1 hypothetical protein SA21269_2451 [Staphylococcus aureus subsp. aureus 21269]EWC67340.1 membrane protein [Staphylococcus aureus subsp. aureus ST 1413]EZI08463.1 hypothetical protein SA21337_0540 [Staphylococcus aureus subsp. aureus 21337]KDP59105.1 hypothetical protein SA21320_1535 [Staphylococcu